MGEIFILIAVITLQKIIFANELVNNLNLAEGRPTRSSTAAYISEQAVDGDRNPVFGAASCWEAAFNDCCPYWMVDLGRDCTIESVTITNRGDCCGDRLRDFVIEVFGENPEQVSAASRVLCYNYIGEVTLGATESLACTKRFVSGRYVRIRRLNTRDAADRFTLCEVEVYGSIGSCFETSFIHQSSSRNTGTVIVTSGTSRADCSSVCVRHSTCDAFNYNTDTSTCEIVTVCGTVLSSPGWDHYQINHLSN